MNTEKISDLAAKKILDSISVNDFRQMQRLSRVEKISAIIDLYFPLPIPIVIHCPKCKQQHIDQIESDAAWERRLELQENADPDQWINPPHKTHLCIYCWHKFKPMDVYTTGVDKL